MKIIRFILTAMVLIPFFAVANEMFSRPNIVYIALEDITPMMGCYSDSYAKTQVFE